MEAIEPTTTRLYSPKQISLAAFIGSPIAACWCFVQNFRKLGQPEAAQKWLIWGMGGSFVAMIGLCLVPFPKQTPHYIFPIAYSLAFRGIAMKLQGEAITRHISTGGRLVSWWFVIAIGLLFLIGFVGLLLVIFYLFDVRNA